MSEGGAPQPERSALGKASRVAARASTALRRLLRGLPARNSRLAFPEVADDRLQAHRAVYRFAAGLAAGRTVLDAGCGTGYGAAELVAHGAARAVGVDSDPRVVAYASRRYASEGVAFAVADLESPDGLGDWEAAVAVDTLPYVDDFEAALATLSRGDLLVASVPPVVDEWSMAVDRVNPYARHHFFVLYWAALIETAFGLVRSYRLRQPAGTSVDLRDPFPSRLEPGDLTLEEADQDGLAADPGVLVVLVGERR